MTPITAATATPYEYPFCRDEQGEHLALPSMDDIKRALESISTRFEQEERAIMRMRTALSQMPKSCFHAEEAELRGIIDRMEKAHDENVNTFAIRMRLCMGSYVRGER